jgi:adenylate cyclase
VSLNNIPQFQQIRARVNRTMGDGIQLNMSTEESKKMLRRHVNSNTNLVIMFVDINDSTSMSLSLSENKFALLLYTFAQEISIAISGYGGYVFKYEGDAVISLFPAQFNQAKACENAVSCSKSILEIIREVINPAFRENGLPAITVKIGLAYGDALVVLYGKSLEKAHIDIIGSSISMASKIASVAKPNQVLVGELIYEIFLSTFSNKYLKMFREINLDQNKWNYPSHIKGGRIYRVYEYIEDHRL